MSDEKRIDYHIRELQYLLPHIKFADRVQMIHKVLKLIVETLDGMEAEVKKECP
jgi:hypothetical protein